MKKFTAIIIMLILLTTPIFSALNKHGYVIFDDWVSVGSNEGSWVRVDLGSYVSNKQSYVRISFEVTAYDTDDTEFVTCRVREYLGNYKTERSVFIRYLDGLKGELDVWTDDNGEIEYKLEYGWAEIKRINVKIVLENSIN